MPLYEYKCPNCSHTWTDIRPVDDRNNALCTCGTVGRQVFSVDIHAKPKYSWVRGWWDNIDTDPIFINDKDHLLAECGKRGLIPKAFGKREDQGKGIQISNAYRGRR